MMIIIIIMMMIIMMIYHHFVEALIVKNPFENVFSDFHRRLISVLFFSVVHWTHFYASEIRRKTQLRRKMSRSSVDSYT